MMVMTQKSNPCYNCSERRVGCHAECEKYLAKYAENEARKAALREKTELDMLCYMMYCDSTNKRKRKRNLK